LALLRIESPPKILRKDAKAQRNLVGLSSLQKGALKMKRIPAMTVLFLIAISLARAESSALAQPTATPEGTVQRFYAWYLHALNQNQEPLEKHQTELSKYVTQRLMKSLNRALKRPDGIDADFFIDAQDFDEAWEKNISTSKAAIQGERATVNLTLKGGPAFGNRKLKVGLRKESGVWKIDSVNNRMNP
jgi:Protein of unknown function (DUF3828)